MSADDRYEAEQLEWLWEEKFDAFVRKHYEHHLEENGYMTIYGAMGEEAHGLISDVFRDWKLRNPRGYWIGPEGFYDKYDSREGVDDDVLLKWFTDRMERTVKTFLKLREYEDIFGDSGFPVSMLAPLMREIEGNILTLLSPVPLRRVL